MSTYDDLLILAWADDEYVIGQQLVTITGMYGPDLEESIAIGSIAQDHLGHAAKLYRLLSADENGVNRLVYDRQPSQYHSCHLADAWQPEDWAFIVVRHLLYDLADRERERWAVQFDAPWPGLAGLMLRETELHLAHWTEWSRVLSSEAEGQQRLAEAFAAVRPLADDFFVAPAGAPDAWAPLREPWQAAVDAVFPASAMRLPSQISPRTIDPTSGRDGAHMATLAPLLNAAHAYHQSHSTWQWE